MNKITKTITLLSLFPLQSAIGMEQDNFDQRLNKRNQSHIVSDRAQTSVSSPRIKRERLNDVVELPKATHCTQRSAFSHFAIHPLYEMCSPATNAEQFAQPRRYAST